MSDFLPVMENSFQYFNISNYCLVKNYFAVEIFGPQFSHNI